MRKLPIVLLLLLPRVATAQTLPTDHASGRRFPDLTADCPLTVAKGQTQTIATATSHDCLGVKGILNVSAPVRVGTLLVYPGGELNVTAGADISVKPIAPSDAGQYGTGLLLFGRVRMTGTPKTAWSRLTAELLAGETTIAVANADGWRVGDRLIVPDTRDRFEFDKPQPETFTITALSGTTVTLDRPAAVDHPGARNAKSELERFAPVGNLTRDVVIRSENPAGVRGHLLASAAADVVVKHVEIRDMGRTVIDQPIGATNHIGRYALHLHHQDGPALIEGNAVWNCDPSRWGITVHHSNGKTVRDNVVFNCAGWGIGTEDGTEHSNLFERNLAVLARGLPGGTAEGQAGNTGSCLWFESPQNVVKGNIGVNCRNGITVFGQTGQRLAEFSDNETIGNHVGFEPWRLFSGGDVVRLRSWHNIQADTFLYPTTNVTMTDYYSRGDPRRPHAENYLWANSAGDYAQINLRLLRPDIQNKNTGWHLIYGSAGGLEPWQPLSMSVVDGTFCGNGTHVLFRQDGLSYGGPSPAITITTSNNRDCSGALVTTTRDGALKPNQKAPVTISDVTGSAPRPSPPTDSGGEGDRVPDNSPPQPAPQGATIAINPSQRHQVFHSWGAAVLQTISDYSSLTAADWNAVLTTAVTDLNIMRVRLEVPSGVEGPHGSKYASVNDNRNPNDLNAAGFNWSSVDWQIDNVLRPFREKVVAAGKAPYIYLQYVDFGPSRFEHYENPREYAELMLAVFQHMQSKYGFVPEAISVMLEPNDVSGWTPQALAASIKATATRLQAAGFAVPEFIAPETSNMDAFQSYVDQLMADSQAGALIKEFSYHRYGGNTDANMAQITARAVKHGKRTSMLEFWTEHLNYQRVQEDLVLGRNSGWDQGVFADNFSCQSSHLMRVSNGVVSLCPNTKVNQHFFQNIRAGAQRIGASAQETWLKPSAWINSDGSYAVLIVAESAGKFSVGPLPAGTYKVRYAEAGGTQATTNLPDVRLSSPGYISTTMPTVGLFVISGPAGQMPSK
jgi:hypothetical protein